MRFINQITKLVCLFFVAAIVLSCHKEQVIPVTIDINYTVKDSNYTVPVNVNFINKTSGAENYKWTFEGGEPATSSKRNPGTIVYTTAGNHKVILEAWNDDDKQAREITVQIDSSVHIDFDTTILVNHFSPVTVQLHNKTTGGSIFHWTFEDGIPATSDLQNPPNVLFTTPGDHNINLQVSNGSANFYLTKTIAVAPPMAADFDILPSFEDEDYEAPLTATLQNTTVSGTLWQWSANGGIINDLTAKTPVIYFANPGQYSVTLAAGNGKSNQIINKIIEVKPNSNLRTHANVKFGISTAHPTIGCFYSTRLRKIFTQNDNLDTSGKWIDVAFFGINQNFTFNKFISPDSAAAYAFSEIPQAPKTKFINSQELCNCGVNFTATTFDNMIDDTPLQGLVINPTQEGWHQFDNAMIPRIVLFQTEDGRKGAIKVKQLVQDGPDSYIIADIKIQKNF